MTAAALLLSRSQGGSGSGVISEILLIGTDCRIGKGAPASPGWPGGAPIYEHGYRSARPKQKAAESRCRLADERYLDPAPYVGLNL
jgi:hypothetical protein